MNENRSKAGKLESLQVFRGLAALSVIFYHVSLQFKYLVTEVSVEGVHSYARLGSLGVDFFFVLSGFIIFLIHQKDLGVPASARGFAIKRVIRIWPLVLAIVLIKSCYVALVRPADLSLIDVVNNLLLLPGPKLVGVSWTLTFEMLFYCAFFFAIVFGKKFAYYTALIWALIVLVFAMSGVSPADPLRTFVSPYILQFLAGALTAWVWRRVVLSRKISWVLGLTVLGLAIIGASFHPFNATHREWVADLDPIAGRALWGVVFCGTILLAVSNEALFQSRAMALLGVLGNASYAIYLFHNEMITLLIVVFRKLRLYGSVPTEVLMASVGIAVLIGGIVVHFLLERPLLRLCKKRATLG